MGFSIGTMAQNENCSLLFLYYGETDNRVGKAIETLQQEKKDELGVLNEKVKEIKQNRKNNLIAGLAVGAAVVGSAVAVGVSAAKERQAKNEAAKQQQLAERKAQQAAADAEYQQRMAAKGIDVTKTQTEVGQRVVVGQNVNNNQQTPQVTNKVAQPSIQTVHGIAVVNGTQCGVTIKAYYDGFTAKITEYKITGTTSTVTYTDNSWQYPKQGSAFSTSHQADGELANEYKYKVHDNGVTLYFTL